MHRKHFFTTVLLIMVLAFQGSGPSVSYGQAPTGLIEVHRFGDGELVTLDASPDNTRLAVVGAVGWQIFSVDTLAGQTISQDASYGIRSIAWSPDGEQLVTGDAGGSVALWSATTGDLLQRFSGHQGAVLSVAWSPDGLWVVSGGEDNVVFLWSVENNQLQSRFYGHANDVLSVAFNPRSTQIASSSGGTSPSSDTAIRIWDIQSGQLVKTLTGHGTATTRVRWSADGARFASAGEDGTLRIWYTATWGEVAVFDRTGYGLTGFGGISTFVWKEDGLTLLFATQDVQDGRGRLVFEWSLDDLSVREVADTTYVPSFIDITLAGDQLFTISGHFETALEKWDVQNSTLSDARVWQTAPLESLTWSTDNQHVAVGSQLGAVQVLDITTDESVYIRTQSIIVRQVTWSPDGTHLAIAGNAGRIDVRDTANPRQSVATLNVGTDVLGLAWAPDGESLAIGRSGDAPLLWTLTEEVGNPIEAAPQGAQAIAFSPVDATLAISIDKLITFLVPTTDEILKTIPTDGTINPLRWSRDGQFMAGSDCLRGVYVWNVETGEQLWQNRLNGACATSLDWFPTGDLLAVADTTGQVYFLNPTDGQAVFAPLILGEEVVVRWSLDGQWLATGGKLSGSVRLWSLPAEN